MEAVASPLWVTSNLVVGCFPTSRSVDVYRIGRPVANTLMSNRLQLITFL